MLALAADLCSVAAHSIGDNGGMLRWLKIVSVLLGLVLFGLVAVRQAVVPEQAVAAISAALLRKSGPASAPVAPKELQPWWPRRARLDQLSWPAASQGKTLHLTQLVASAGNLSARGDVAMAGDKSLSGRIDVDLAAAAAGTAIGVPLVVGGTLDNPSVTLSRDALIGAAIGTALMPGVGTAAGAKLGDRVGQGLRCLFGK